MGSCVVSLLLMIAIYKKCCMYRMGDEWDGWRGMLFVVCFCFNSGKRRYAFGSWCCLNYERQNNIYFYLHMFDSHIPH